MPTLTAPSEKTPLKTRSLGDCWDKEKGKVVPASLEEALAENAQLREEIARLSKELEGPRKARPSEGLQHSGDASIAEHLSMPIWRHLQIRLPWLVLLLLLQSFSASIMHVFEDVLEAHLVLALFVAMIVGAGGNAGNQPGVIMTRGLSQEREYIYKHIGAMIRLESTIAVVQGTLLGLIAFTRVFGEYPEQIWSAFVIGLTTLFVVLLSVFLGIRPSIGFSLGIDRCNLDPAASSAPLVTACTDMCGITLLCFLGLVILGWAPDGVPSYCEKIDNCPSNLEFSARNSTEPALKMYPAHIVYG